MNIFITHEWLVIIGLMLVIFELLTFSSLGGSLFIGLGFICAGASVWLFPEVFKDSSMVFIMIALFSVFFTMLLWKPLKRLQDRRIEDTESSDYIGQEILLPADLKRGGMVDVTFSGAPWSVKMDSECPEESISAGQTVRVTSVKVGVLTVSC